MDIQTQRVETQEERNPAQVRDDRFFVFQDAGKNVILVRLWIVVTDEEDCAVSKRTNHQEACDVLVVGVQRCRRGEVPCNEGIGRHRVHMLRN